MKKYLTRSMAAMSAMCVLLMTGCSKGIDINNEQNEIIANYAARLVVKVAKVDYTYIPDIKEPDADISNDDIIDETQTDADGNIIAAEHDYSPLSDYLGLDGVEITYKDCIVGDEYPNDDSSLFVVEAEPGKKLVAVEYSLTNNTDSDIVYSIPQDGLVFRLKVNGSKSVMSFKTLLLNDFSNMKNYTIGAGQTNTAVIVFQLDSEDADSLSTVEVRYGAGGSYLPKEPK